MNTKKSKVFIGVMTDCYEFNNVEDFKTLQAIAPLEQIDYILKAIGTAFSKRKPTDSINFLINLLHSYCNREELTFSVEELENEEMCITISDVAYIFGLNYLRVIL